VSGEGCLCSQRATDVIPRRFVELAIGMREARLGADQARKLGLKLLTEADTIEDLTPQVYV
jgi:hypothetical protein